MTTRTFPEETNRRAVLRGVLAGGAIGATVVLPAVVTAGIACSHHPDAELFALIERARTTDSLVDEASVAADDVLEQFAPSRPEALTWAAADAPHWYMVRAGKPISNSDIDFLREWLPLERKPDPIAAGVVPVLPTLKFVERAREIIQTKDEFEASWQAAKEHPDVLKAHAREEALHAQWRELAERVATTPAKTTEGLLAKFALIASGYAEDELDGTYDGILASAALDAQSLTNAGFNATKA